MTDDSRDASLAKAQSVRLRRMLWGFFNQSGSILVVLLLWLFELLPNSPVLIYLPVMAAINFTFLALLLSNYNLHFRDPSMTAAQIVAPLWPAIFVMYFITDPLARAAFLLLAASGLVFGMFALSRRGMVVISMVIGTAYLVLLAALALFSEQQLDWRVEGILVFAYFVVLLTIAYLTSYIAGLRQTLRAQNTQLQELVCKDPLTELPNRRSLMEQLRFETARVSRRSPDKSALCLCMLDLDHFKRINDTYGHDVGDHVLCQIGHELQKGLRQADFVGRFGGEEFVIILPESNLDAALQTIDRLRSRIAELRIDDLPEGEQITVSMGLACYQPGESMENTLKRADNALLKAKTSGRNLIEIAETVS